MLCVGKLREPGARLLVDEYAKRLRRFLTFEEIEVPDLPEPRGAHEPTPAEIRQITDTEGAELFKRIRPGDALAALTIGGERFTSEGFAGWLSKRAAESSKRLCFMIGGSLGLSPSVEEKARWQLSLSSMTLTHSLARVVLLEQLYRACKINAGERYHK
ncbi:ribosomal RNA large subunit methyltransferase H [Clostridia bacterium]|nr:ribosomal RNA large subunit methyltransferase H [Clostridia bacterium]